MNIEKKYDIIYMDPPWRYARDAKSSSSKQVYAIEDYYPTMTLEELKQLDVKSITNKDAIIYMWVTNPKLDWGIELGKHWGFDFKTVAFVWEKQGPLQGHYTMGETEQVLVFKKKGGKIPQPRGARNVRQFLSERKREHSRKPDEIRRRIEEIHPTQSKLEMFARTAPEGWDVWGNETDKFTE